MPARRSASADSPLRYVRMATAKLHAVTVTEANLHYMGSITIDEALLDAAGLAPYQMVQITNQSNGAFWQTYAIPGRRGSGVICLNGTPARHFQPGDKAYIIAEGFVEPARVREHVLVVVFVDEKNRPTRIEQQSASGTRGRNVARPRGRRRAT